MLSALFMTFDDLKVAAAIAVAAKIHADIVSAKNDSSKLKRLRIASDAVDRTVPLSSLRALYDRKAPDQTDGQFLLEHLAHLVLLAPQQWPAYKVPPREWGEYTRVMRGLDTFLRIESSATLPTRAQRHDLQGLFAFIHPIVSRMAPDLAQGFDAWQALLA